MNTAAETRTVTVERELPYAPAKIWRALTQPHLLGEWLMQTDFQPIAGHGFQFRADWGSVDCKVLAIEPNRALSYSWTAYGLQTVVIWTLTPTATGTHLRMEQSGFPPENKQAYQGAIFGWQKFFGNLEQVLAQST